MGCKGSSVRITPSRPNLTRRLKHLVAWAFLVSGLQAKSDDDPALAQPESNPKSKLGAGNQADLVDIASSAKSGRGPYSAEKPLRLDVSASADTFFSLLQPNY